MKKLFFLLTSVALFSFASCSSDDHKEVLNAERNLNKRAELLGFADLDTYITSVTEECQAGNHQNCDVLTGGAHQPCAYVDHSGASHDGTHHNGLEHNHSKHDKNGHHDAKGHH